MKNRDTCFSFFVFVLFFVFKTLNIKIIKKKLQKQKICSKQSDFCLKIIVLLNITTHANIKKKMIRSKHQNIPTAQQ